MGVACPPRKYPTEHDFDRHGYEGRTVDTAMDILVVPNRRDDDAVLA